MHQIIICPACDRKVQLPREYLGRSVQCPECKQTFLAGDPTTGISTDPDALPTRSAAAAAAEPATTTPRYPASYDDDDPFDDWGVRRPQLRHDHGGLVLALGIISIVVICLGIVLGPIAYFVGTSDLRAIDRGEMEPGNRSMVQAGRIIGAVGFCLGMFYLLAYVGYFAFVFAMIGG
jgi:hypothetical protein